MRRKVLPADGIKEKILATKRADTKELIPCQQNQKNVEDINPDFLKGLKFNYVDGMEEVLEIAF